MSRFKSALLKSFPVFLITIATLAMSLLGFDGMLDKQTEKCWDYLSVATRTMAEKIQLRFDANLALLQHMADAIVLKADLDQQSEVLDYLASIQRSEDNFFSRIDILLPDSTLILQNGETVAYGGDTTYQDLESFGAHVSPRYVDLLTKRQAVYCFAPIRDDGETIALLIGMVDCHALHTYFPSYSYDGEAAVFLMDRQNGDFLMDEWHPELGNMYELGEFELLEGQNKTDFRRDITQGKEGSVAFLSGLNGKASYMYYMPVQGYPWSAAMMLQDETVFRDLNELHATLQVMCLLEIALLVFCLGWNFMVNLRLSGHEADARRMEVERIANETKSSFLSTMSHDIRTPLNGIVGMLEVISRHDEDPELVRDCLRKIGVSTQYLMTLTNDVLDLNEMESGKFTLSSEPMDLALFAEDLDVLIKARADEAGITCHIDHTRLEHRHVLGSEVHLRRIMVNLITNAIKYSKPDGHVWINLEEMKSDEETAEYRFIVRDTGIGMTREFQKNMFNSFEQETADARTRYRGHGLGLTIVNRLVQKMGGTIHVESEKEKGSTFIITLTFPIDHEKRAAGRQQSHHSMDLTGARILLVEDNELNLEIASILLTDAGASVTAKVNGREAVEAFAASEAFAFDAILMDVMMPEMDGLEATRTIRRMERPDAKKVPIIAMTAGTFAEDVRQCREAGMDEHVGKPLNMEEMLSKIARHMDAAKRSGGGYLLPKRPPSNEREQVK